MMPKIKHRLRHACRTGGRRPLLKNLRMKAARVGRDLSQEELAARVGVTRQTIGMIEAGRFNPSLALCVAICRALGKTLNDLFWDEEGEA